MISQDCPLISMHIPKTGGMSIFAGMCDHFGSSMADMYDISALDNNIEPVKSALSDTSKSVYIGHFPFGMHEWLTRPACYMAVVRKPLDRILSLYFYTIQFRDNLLNISQETGKSITDLFDSGKIADIYKEYIPWIEGEQTLGNFLDCQSPEHDNGMVRRFSGIGLEGDQCPPDAFELAKHNIEKYFAVVGVQERYPDTLSLLRMTFKWAWLAEYHVNKGVERQQKGRKGYRLTKDLQRRIKDMNQMDMKLYDWVLNRFEKQLKDPIPPLTVPGGGRTDYDKVKLWTSIGSSPVRKAAMKNSPGNR